MSEGRADLLGKKFLFNREPFDDEPEDRFFMSATNQKPIDMDQPFHQERGDPEQKPNFKKKTRPETANQSPSHSTANGTAATAVHQSDSNLAIKLQPVRPVPEQKPPKSLQPHNPASKFRDLQENTTIENGVSAHKQEEQFISSRG